MEVMTEGMEEEKLIQKLVLDALAVLNETAPQKAPEERQYLGGDIAANPTNKPNATKWCRELDTQKRGRLNAALRFKRVEIVPGVDSLQPTKTYNLKNIRSSQIALNQYWYWMPSLSSNSKAIRDNIKYCHSPLAEVFHCEHEVMSSPSH